MVELNTLRFYVLKSADLKGDATTETAGCTFSPFQNAALDAYEDGDLIGTATCDLPADGSLAAGTDSFRLVKSGEKVWIENPAGEKLHEINPATEAHVLLRKHQSTNGTPYMFSAFAHKTGIEIFLDRLKKPLRTTTHNVDFTQGPIVPLAIGGIVSLGGTEIDLPGVRDELLGTLLPRYAADGFRAKNGGFALDASLNWPFVEHHGARIFLDTALSLGVNLRSATLYAPDTVSGIPGEESSLSYVRGGLQWRPGFSMQTWARAFADRYIESHWARWDTELRYVTSLIEGESFDGNFPWGGRSLAEPLDVAQTLHIGSPAGTRDDGFVLGAKYCLPGGRYAPCFGLTYQYHTGRTFRSGGFGFDIGPQHDLLFSGSFWNAVKTESTPITAPYTVVVNDAPSPTIAPPPLPQSDPQPPPPAMVPIPPPLRLRLEIRGAEATFAVGSAALNAATRQTVEAKMVHPIGDFWRKLLAQGYAPTTPLYINIGGFASSDGSFANNLRLSDRRAASVQGYLATRFRQLNDAAWREARRDDPKLRRADWSPPYPDPRTVVFQARGYGETELICKDPTKLCSPVNDATPDSNEDLINSRRFVAGVFTDAKEAAAALKDVVVTGLAATNDEALAATIATRLQATGVAAKYAPETKTIYLVVPVTWNGARPNAGRGTPIYKLAATVQRLARDFRGMSRAVSFAIGIVSEPPAVDPAGELERAEIIKDTLFGHKQFRTWPVNGLSSVTPVPRGLSDPLAYLERATTKLVAPTPMTPDQATTLLGAKVKSVTIAGVAAKFYTIPVSLDAGGQPTAELLAVASALGVTTGAHDWLYAVLYRHPETILNSKVVMQKLYARLTDAFRTQRGVEAIDPNHFVMEEPATALTDKATRLYVVVSDKEIPRPALADKIFRLAIPQQP